MSKEVKNSCYIFICLLAIMLCGPSIYAREFKPGPFTLSNQQIISEDGIFSPDGNIIVRKEDASEGKVEISFYASEDDILLYKFTYNPKDLYAQSNHDYLVAFSPDGSSVSLELYNHLSYPAIEYLVDIKHAKGIYSITYDPRSNTLNQSVEWYYSQDGHITMIKLLSENASQMNKLIFVDAELGRQLYSIEYHISDSTQAWISDDGRRVEGYAGSNNFSFPVPSASIPDDPNPPLPPVNARFGGLIDIEESQ